MIFTNNSYYNSLDRIEDRTSDNEIEDPIELSSGAKSLNMDLGPQEIGTSLNPFQHALHALNAKIKEGASKVEFEFFGAGKGQKDRATPESFDKEERAEMRALAEINEVQSSTHATVAVTGLAGFNPQRGFEEQNRNQTLREVKKAIDFAAEASTGGAIVLHTGEWDRPIFDEYGSDKTAGEIFNFTGYAEEEKRGMIPVVDARTGNMTTALRKDEPIYEPVFTTVAEREKELGVKLVGKKATNDETYAADDWIGISGEAIKRGWEYEPEKAKAMFRRVPHWNSAEMEFETTQRDWKYFQEKAKNWNEQHPGQDLAPEELFAKTQFMNSVLQARGSSLYHGQRYDMYKEHRDAAKKALEFYEKLDKTLPEEEKRRLVTKKGLSHEGSGLIPPKDMPIVDYLREQVKENENSMRYIHEASASADVQATKAQESMNNVMTVKKYGLKKSAESLAELGIQTWRKYEANKEHLQNPLFVAPENWNPLQYGSHPDELKEMVLEGRKAMVSKLSASLGKERAKEIAERHIKSTFDIGHLNLWKSHMQRKTDANGVPIESDEQFDKRFGKWALNKVKEMHEAKVLGHIHLSDNFGYDDEHINVGKGNAPIKEIMAFMVEKGYKDFVAEPGSYNPQTVLPEAWSFFGSPTYHIQGGGQGRFSQMHKRHFGYDAPPMYIVGAYSPSNEWKLWSEVPLE